MTQPIRYGILGPGKIAHKFADAFQSVPGAKLQAVASKDPDRRKEFASKWNIPTMHASYEALASDPEVDIVYIATPHPFHFEQSKLCLEHGKPVICEKPLTMNHSQTKQLIDLAQKKNTFLMEGMWSRFFPATQKVVALLQQGVVGPIRFARADFGFAAPFNPANRVFNLSLGGGAQLDVGVYPLFLMMLLLGKPKEIQAAVHKSSTGVDETTSAQFVFEGGAVAQIASSIVADTPKQGDIVGTLGTITLLSPWHKSQQVAVKLNQGETETFDYPFTGFGFEYELAHVTECLQKGLKESPMMPYALSLLMAETADEILRQGKVVYS